MGWPAKWCSCSCCGAHSLLSPSVTVILALSCLQYSTLQLQHAVPAGPPMQ